MAEEALLVLFFSETLEKIYCMLLSTYPRRKKSVREEKKKVRRKRQAGGKRKKCDALIFSLMTGSAS
jgi:hypothetical protein